jgi:hypothetical protein
VAARSFCDVRLRYLAHVHDPQTINHQGLISMTQHQLNCAVARATGESLSTIARRGFSPLDDSATVRKPYIVDWDSLDADRPGLFPARPKKRGAAK